MSWALRFHGVGNASAVELGSAMATIERDGRPWLTIDCGAEGVGAGAVEQDAEGLATQVHCRGVGQHSRNAGVQHVHGRGKGRSGHGLA